jgi:hypothetical protein
MQLTDVIPDKMWISWGGRTLHDEANLFEAGVRTDDTVLLEYANPLMPKPLMVLRTATEKKGKKGKGGKGKGKKKK